MNENECVIVGLSLVSSIVRFDNGEMRFLRADSTPGDVRWTRHIDSAYLVNGFERAQNHASLLRLRETYVTEDLTLEVRQIASFLRVAKRSIRDMIEQRHIAKISVSTEPRRILEL